jgi:hypothetical protein
MTQDDDIHQEYEQRANKLVKGLNHDIKQFTGAVASRAGVNSSRSMVYSYIPDEPPEPDGVDDYFWDSPLVRGIFKKGRFKGIGRRMRKLREILDEMNDVEDRLGLGDEYKHIVDDMGKYGMLREMARYGVSIEPKSTTSSASS